MNEIIQAPEFAVPPEAGEEQHENPLLMVHRHLRGRYKAAIVLAILLGIPLAAIGYLAVPPMYTSTGLVRVAPQIQLTMYTKDIQEAQVPPFFDSFVRSQAALLSSRRVLDDAIGDPRMAKAGWPKGTDGLVQLQKDLDVSNRQATELIMATVRSKKPEMAQAAVNSILTSYLKFRDDIGGNKVTDQERDLADRKASLTQLIDKLRANILETSNKYGTDDVDEIHAARLAEVVKLDSNIQSIKLMQAQRNGKPGADPSADNQPKGEDTSDLVLAQQDGSYAKLLDEELTLQTELDRLAHTVTKEHREYKQLENRLNAVQAQKQDARQRLLALPQGQLNLAAAPGGMTSEQLQSMLDRYTQLRSSALDEARDLERVKTTVASFKDQIADAKHSLDETSRALDQIRFEKKQLEAGRVSVLQFGDLPLQPSTDRRVPLAVLGFLGGGAIGVGIVFLSSVVSGGYRYIDELERSEASLPLLGTVPDLRSADPEHESMAALSVHHLRNMLQLQFEGSPGGKVYTVTSAAAGDGKTSLAIALAMSFAATGRRTLIVDTDLVGRGLTRQLEMAGVSGLCDAVRAAKVNGDIHATKVPSLWAMPAGVVQGFVPEHLSGGVMTKILGELRKQYDTIVLDTGPIMGSLEANVVAPASDSVVLVVSRGQASKSVRASIQRIRRLGARCSGLVFNRAATNDFDRSVSTASVSARSVRASAQAARRGGSEGRTALMRAVSAPTMDDQGNSRS